MTANISNSWWESYRQVAKSSKWHRELISLVNNRQDIAQKMIDVEKAKHPGKSESWYISKIICDLRVKSQNFTFDS
jgi:hypothetical protein